MQVVVFCKHLLKVKYLINTLFYHIFTCKFSQWTHLIYIIIIETKFKTGSSIKICFYKENVWLALFFFPKGHVRGLISRDLNLKQVFANIYQTFLRTGYSIPFVANMTSFGIVKPNFGTILSIYSTKISAFSDRQKLPYYFQLG